jgi:hypothetical protein
MNQLRIVRMKTRVSLVVRLRDGYTSGPPADRSLDVRLAGYPRKPVGKHDGTYIFNDLEPGTYRLEIASTYYFRESIDVSVGSANVIVHIPLVPLPSYPFQPNATLIRAVAVDRSGRPVADAVATATMLSEECAVGWLADEKTAKGSDEIAVAAAVGPFGVGDRFRIGGRTDKEGGEAIRLREIVEHRKRFRLETPLSSTNSRGAKLYPVCVTRTTDRGELAVALPPGKAGVYKVELKLEAGSRGLKAQVREIEAAEGQTVNLGTWIV